MASNTEVKILSRSNMEEAVWNRFIAASPQGANYSKTWYLDVLWPGWQGIHVFYKNQLKAVMPIKVSKKYGIHYCFQPPFSQYGGICFEKMTGKPEKVLALKKRLATAIVEAIPKNLKHFVLNFSPAMDYALPFYWAGYSLQTRYSFWLENHPDKESLFRQFNERTRTYINKARKSGLTVIETEDVSSLLDLSKTQAGYELDYQLLEKLWEVLCKHQVGKAVEVRDENQNLHAGLIYQISGDQQIHLFSAKNKELDHFGGMSFAIWESIKRADDSIRIHDFEGSMLEPVEKFFRGFGTSPVPYLQIRKNNFPKMISWLFE